MSVYALLWQLIKHTLRGRGRDEVFLQVAREGGYIGLLLSGALQHLSYPDRPDRFCILSAKDRDGAPW